MIKIGDMVYSKQFKMTGKVQHIGSDKAVSVLVHKKEAGSFPRGRVILAGSPSETTAEMNVLWTVLSDLVKR